MQLTDERSTPTAWIPWILALAAVFGWTALAPDHLTVGKGKRQDGMGLVQVADDLPAPGIASHPLAGLVPSVGGEGRPPGISGRLLAIEVVREAPPTAVRRGRVQGRAPPRCA